MTASTKGTARRNYRILLQAYPLVMRDRYGKEMEETFLALLRCEGERRGFRGKVNIWIRGGWDAVAGGLIQRFDRGPDYSGRDWPCRRPVERSGVREMLGTIWGDIRFAVRALIRRPLFSAIVILTLAVGIGANASVFTRRSWFSSSRRTRSRVGAKSASIP